MLTPSHDLIDWGWTTLLTYYNGSRFFERAYASVCAALQQLAKFAPQGHSMRVVIVDDCSSDDEATKLQKIVARLSHPVSCSVEIVRLPVNGGVSNARHEGLRKIGQSFLHIMDQDDEVRPDFYVSVIGIYTRLEDRDRENVMWISGYETIDAEDRITGRGALTLSKKSSRHLNDIDRWLSEGNQVHGGPGMVVLSPALKEAVEQFFSLLDRSVDGSDDYWMFIYLLKKGAHFIVADELGYRYRRHEYNQSIGHDFLSSAQRGLVIMREANLLSQREYSIIAARYQLLTRVQHFRSRPMKFLAYMSFPAATWRLLRARLLL